MKKETNMKEYTLPKGTVCKINGIPFALKEDTVISCHEGNWKLMHEDQKACDPIPNGVSFVNPSDSQPTCKARTYQYPAATLKKVAELLGVEEEFASIETISLNFLASSTESKEGFPPVLFVVVGGVTHAEDRRALDIAINSLYQNQS